MQRVRAYSHESNTAHQALGKRSETKKAAGTENADSWYARKTASLIARCQDNIGYLMTFAHSQCKPPPGGRTYGSDLPRSCDLPGFILLFRRAPRRRGGSRAPRRRSSVGSARRRRSARTVRCYHHPGSKEHFLTILAYHARPQAGSKNHKYMGGTRHA